MIAPPPSFRPATRTPVTRFTDPQDLPFIVGVKDAAKWLGIHHDTLRGHAAEGLIPCLRVGSRLCFRRDTLLASLERGGKSFLKKRTNERIVR